MAVEIIPDWMVNLDDKDISFIKNFIMASGSLKEVATQYGVTYPTVRLRLDKLIQKIQITEDAVNEPYIALIKRLAANEKVDFDAARILIAEYTKAQKIAGSQEGGTSYIHARGMRKIIEQYMDNASASVETTSGSVENAKLVASNRCQMGFVLADIAKYAYLGQNPFDRKLTSLRMMMVGQKSFVHVVTRTDVGINSIGDLKGKRVGVGSSGSYTSMVAVPGILKAYDMSYDDIDEYFLNMKETTEALSNGTVDVGIYLAGIPAGGVTELAQAEKAKLISIGPKYMQKIIEDMPILYNRVIKGGTYKSNEEDVPVVAVRTCILTNDQVSEDTIYQIVKTMFTHQKDWMNIHPGTAEFTPERLANFGEYIMPLHAGAIKYLKEIGLK